MVDVQFWLQLAVVLFCLAVGGRFGGVGLGAAGGFGVSILVLGFGMQPGSPPRFRPFDYYRSDCLYECLAGLGRFGLFGRFS